MWNASLAKIATVKHHIDLRPSCHPAIRHSKRAEQKTKEQESQKIDYMLNEEAIDRLQLKRASPVVLVPQKNRKARFFVEYGKLNALPVRYIYSLLRVYECIDSLKGAAVFSTGGCRNEYCQTEIPEVDRNTMCWKPSYGGRG